MHGSRTGQEEDENGTTSQESSANQFIIQQLHLSLRSSSAQGMPRDGRLQFPAAALETSLHASPRSPCCRRCPEKDSCMDELREPRKSSS